MGCRDVLLPKSQDEIWEAIQELSPDEMLSKCVRGGFLSGVKTALRNGAEINSKNNKKTSYLYSASIDGHTEIVYCLLEAGAEARYDDLLTALKNPPVFGRMLQNINPKLLMNSKFNTLYKFAKLKGLREIRYLIEERINQKIT
jgi:hypothetical protein